MSADDIKSRAAVLLPFMLSEWSIVGAWTRSLIYHPIHPNSSPDVLWPPAKRSRHFTNTQSHAMVDHYQNQDEKIPSTSQELHTLFLHFMCKI